MLFRPRALASVLLLSSLFAFSALFSLLAQAQSGDVQAQIDDRTQKISDLEDEIKRLQVDLDQTSKQKQTLQTAIKTLDLSNRKLQAQISLTQAQISRVDLQITHLSQGIATTTDRIGTDQWGVEDMLRGLNEADARPIALSLLSGSSLSQLFDEVAALDAARDDLRQQITALASLKTTLQTTKSAAQDKRDELSALKASLRQQQAALSANIASKNDLLRQTKNQESSYQRIIAQKKAQEAEFEAELEQFQSQLKNDVDPTSLPHPGKGVLSWPLDSIRITQYFGNTDFATQNAQIYNGHGHSGVDFAASPGTRVKSAQQGAVLGTGNTDLTCPGASYGKWVLVKHQNGLATLYAHLSVISVSAGDQVSVGQTLGYSGSTGYATGPHLHFGVFAADAVQISSFPSKGCPGKVYTMPVAPLQGYLNPLSYL